MADQIARVLRRIKQLWILSSTPQPQHATLNACLHISLQTYPNERDFRDARGKMKEEKLDALLSVQL